MNKKILIILLTLTIVLTTFGCKTDKNINKVEKINKNKTEDEYYTYIKSVNDKTIKSLKEKYNITEDEKIDKSFVLMGDPYYDLYRNETDVKEYQLPLGLDYDDIKDVSVGLDYRDMMFPENIKIKQLIKQKLRKKYIEEEITEDLILYKVKEIVSMGVEANKEEMKLKGKTEAEWFRDKAIELLLKENSDNEVKYFFDSFYNAYSYSELYNIFGDNLEKLKDYGALVEFKDTSNFKDMKEIIKRKLDNSGEILE